MKRFERFASAMTGALLILVVLACARSGSKSEPRAGVAPITVGSDFASIGLCQAVPAADFEAAMGRKLGRVHTISETR